MDTGSCACCCRKEPHTAHFRQVGAPALASVNNDRLWIGEAAGQGAVALIRLVDDSVEIESTTRPIVAAATSPATCTQLTPRQVAVFLNALSRQAASKRRKRRTASSIAMSRSSVSYTRCAKSALRRKCWTGLQIVGSRVAGNGCPMCTGKVATPSTSLQALYPELANAWDFDRNGDLTPDSVRPGSGQRVWSTRGTDHPSIATKPSCRCWALRRSA